MTKITNISGFPEWLPEQKQVEDLIIEKVRSIYRSYGFVPIETPSVELMSTLCSKGGDEKEIYTLRRQHAEGDEEAELGLHFDLTVPFARYVAQHYSSLDFPFKRYQLQRVWRGERPQKGRFREFYQFDIDIITRDTLPLACDTEVLTVLEKAFSALGVGSHLVRVNNRKLLRGIYASLGLDTEKQTGTIGAVDKLAKIGAAGVERELALLGVSSAVVQRILDVAQVKCSPAEAQRTLQGLGISGPEFEEGVIEMLEVLSLVPVDSQQNMQVDLSLARGLDYYTGTICEVYFTKFMDYGSVGSGGRYENLASEFINRKLPGVGVSFGLSRVMDLILRNNLLETRKKTATDVLVAVYEEAERARCNEIADSIRRNGLCAEVFFRAPKLGKQIEYADNKGIPYVLFLSRDGAIEVKNLLNKEQVQVADIDSWCRELVASRSSASVHVRKSHTGAS